MQIEEECKHLAERDGYFALRALFLRRIDVNRGDFSEERNVEDDPRGFGTDFEVFA